LAFGGLKGGVGGGAEKGIGGKKTGREELCGGVIFRNLPGALFPQGSPRGESLKVPAPGPVRLANGP